MSNGVGWGTHAGVTLCASIVPVILTNPFDVVKVRRQSRRKEALLGAGGVKALLAREGLRGAQLGSFLYFTGYTISPSVKMITYTALSQVGVEEPAARGFISGLVTAVVTSPVWVLKTRCQLLPECNVTEIVRSTYRAEGVRGFYAGLLPSCANKGVEFCVFFAAYERLKGLAVLRQERRQHKAVRFTDSVSDVMGAAGLSRLCASVVAYPMSVVTTRIREPADWGGARRVAAVAREAVATGTLFSGLAPHLMRVIPFSALYFLTYETLMVRLQTPPS
ncbi:putative mitochondrial carrier [Diplonema papillatum]|nr:putative mitochondrial carrier [Diplonema papillatum]